jgi:hypothetical protein
MSARLLHVTNGDAAGDRIREAALAEQAGDVVLAWRDVLHDGPVPDAPDAAVREARARFIAERGWGEVDDVRRDLEARDATLAAAATFGEVVLWFEHDLYDQLQLLQVLDAVARLDGGTARWSTILAGEYLGPATPERLRELWATRAPLAPEQVALGGRGWSAFRGGDPRALEALLHEDTSALPHLGAALRRLLQHFPSARTGLSRTEQQTLDALAHGPLTVARLFVVATQEPEEAIFLGDASFAGYLQGLGAGPEPLVRFDDGTPLTAPRSEHVGDFWQRLVTITDAGRVVRDGRRDWGAMLRVVPGYEGRWIGGVLLPPGVGGWRWDDAAGRLVRIE